MTLLLRPHHLAVLLLVLAMIPTLAATTATSASAAAQQDPARSEVGRDSKRGDGVAAQGTRPTAKRVAWRVLYGARHRRVQLFGAKQRRLSVKDVRNHRADAVRTFKEDMHRGRRGLSVGTSAVSASGGLPGCPTFYSKVERTSDLTTGTHPNGSYIETYFNSEAYYYRDLSECQWCGISLSGYGAATGALPDRITQDNTWGVAGATLSIASASPPGVTVSESRDSYTLSTVCEGVSACVEYYSGIIFYGNGIRTDGWQNTLSSFRENGVGATQAATGSVSFSTFL